ncbi:proline--tRNA ligase [Candidatus Xianfuyuplasma coldseepsis]|uniref:Proline--tRNA ligase n=1 Tax=Candidatus Xianfuyuplasma coldseepsis TaxID=2782163 RepID=A0A7L7KTX5_9MOLU|nr:proline--tRNA ligase [Xianfuyuplasma coldseepsis]QMS85454.1 proline--tRNA ligase [Xianfuyuplasma coldseepsis]
MKQSLLFVPTLKEAPKDAEVRSHKLMSRAGLVKQVAAGIYSYLPLGYRVIKKIENIIREELDKIGSSELLMPALQPRDLWEESGRWDKYGPELMRLTDRKDREFCLGPTHEEIITQVVRDYLNSYKKLPLALYQIQTKFRDEMRPRFGLMRGREFIMKDAYSFHETEAELDEWYKKFAQAYTTIFARCGLATRIVSSDVGQIGGNEADEFMVMSEVGEDTITYCMSCSYAANQEHSGLEEGDKCPVCGGTIKTAKGIEVGNIFKLGTKYSESMNAKVINKDGQQVPVVMGCYGIGISRTLMASVEQHSSDDGIVWPDEIAPFKVHLIPINYDNDVQKEVTDTLYQELIESGIEVLLDDRKERAGVKFKDADLIGLPFRVIIGKDASDGKVEFVDRKQGEKTVLPVAEVINNI